MFRKFRILIISFALISTPPLAFAEAPDVQAQIQTLLVQIKHLQAVLKQLQNMRRSTTCIDLQHTLTLGSTGTDVTNLQNYLITRRYLDSSDNSGYFGFLTAQAVGRMQINLGLVSSQNDPAYGFVGPKTHELISCVIPTESVTTRSSIVPSAAIDTNSLNQTLNTFSNISGIASETPGIIIGLGDPAYDKSISDNLVVPLTNGRWSFPASKIFTWIYNAAESSSYWTTIYQRLENGPYPISIEIGIYDTSGRPLSTGFLMLTDEPAAAAAPITVDLDSLRTTARLPVITGKARNASQVQVEIYKPVSIQVKEAGWSNVGGRIASVVDGQWSFNTDRVFDTPLSTGIYKIDVITWIPEHAGASVEALLMVVANRARSE